MTVNHGHRTVNYQGMPSAQDGFVAGESDGYVARGNSVCKADGITSGMASDLYGVSSARRDTEPRIKATSGKGEAQESGTNHGIHPQISSILGRIIWGSDLRLERESRLVAAGCDEASGLNIRGLRERFSVIL